MLQLHGHGVHLRERDENIFSCCVRVRPVLNFRKKKVK